MPARKSATGVTNYTFVDDQVIAKTVNDEASAQQNITSRGRPDPLRRPGTPVSGIGGRKVAGATRTDGGAIA